MGHFIKVAAILAFLIWGTGAAEAGGRSFAFVQSNVGFNGGFNTFAFQSFSSPVVVRQQFGFAPVHSFAFQRQVFTQPAFQRSVFIQRSSFGVVRQSGFAFSFIR